MFVADIHNDVLQRVIIGEDISIRTNNGHSDLIRLQESCIDLEVFVIWIGDKNSKERAYLKANEFYDKLEDLEKETFNVEQMLLDSLKDAFEKEAPKGTVEEPPANEAVVETTSEETETQSDVTDEESTEETETTEDVSDERSEADTEEKEAE